MHIRHMLTVAFRFLVAPILHLHESRQAARWNAGERLR